MRLFKQAPQLLDEDVVGPATFTIQANLDAFSVSALL